MVNEIKKAFESNTTNAHYFLAISGGVDSMVLSHILMSLKIKHTLLHCNFKLRKTESDEDEIFIQNYANQNKIDYYTTSFNTKKEAKLRHLTIQECARELRYDWFKSFLKNDNSILLTAHHLDDSIETFFINLLRGTGLKGIEGISTNKNNIFRPLLNFTKADILHYAKNYKVKYREDSSNQSDNYLRNKLRHNTIPELKNYTESFTTKMKTFFTEVYETNSYINNQLQTIKSKINTDLKIELTTLKEYPTFLWHKIFEKYNLSRKNNTAFINFTKSNNGAIFITNSHLFLLDRGSIFLKENKDSIIINTSFNKDTEIVKLKNEMFKISILKASKKIKFKTNIAYFNLKKINYPVTIRNWQKGDRIKPLGMNGKKLISDILINKKINNFDKKNQLVLTSNNQLIWLVDLVISNDFALQNNTESILKIEHIKY